MTRRRALGAAWLALVVHACALSPAERADQVVESPAPPAPSVASLVERAEQATANGDDGAAIEAYAQAFDRTPWNTRLGDALANAYARRAARTREAEGARGLPAAEADLRRALELRPDDERLRSNLAVVLVERAVRVMDPDESRALRAAAAELDPDVLVGVEERESRLERRLDLAYELIERGQYDAGILRLRSLHAERPGWAPGTRLLAQALVQQANREQRENRLDAAGAALDEAVSMYAGLDEEAREAARDEVRVAHYNRIVVWIDAVRPTRARRALDEAEQSGFRFDDLRRALDPEPRARSGGGS